MIQVAKLLLLTLLFMGISTVQGDKEISVNDGCPGSCSCTPDLKKVDCRGRNHHEVPHLPPVVEHVDLSHNLITKIPDSAFPGLTNLQYLDLRNNRIIVISNNSFSDCKNLSELVLTANQLDKVNDMTFHGLTNLTIIHLDSNLLTQIPDMSCCSRLQYLYLEDNKRLSSFHLASSFSQLHNLKRLTLSLSPLVTAIQATDFSALSNVTTFKRIYLTRTGVQSVEPGSFQPINNLSSLSIGNNHINASTLQTILTDFKDSTYLMSLDITALSLERNMPESTFQVLGDKSHLASIDMSRNSHIGSIDRRTFKLLSQLVSFKAADCGLTEIPDLTTNKPHLTRIDLSYNSISELQFKWLPASLERLNLNNNRLKSFNKTSHITELRYLFLSNNQINQITIQSLLGLQQLETLDLSSNQLSYIPKGLFKDLIKCTTVDLSVNILTSIDFSELRFMSSLQSVDLSSNKLENLISTDSNQTLKSLDTINLSRNYLPSLHLTDLFVCLRDNSCAGRKVALLDVSHNALQASLVTSNAESLTIKRLDLSHNSLGSFPNSQPAASSFTMSVANLSLSNNRIAIFKQESVDKVEMLATLDLTGNPFSCTCDMRWIAPFLNDTGIKITSASSYACQTPTNERNKKLIHFTLTKFQCLPSWVLAVIVSFASILVCVACGACSYRYRWRIMFCCYKCTKGSSHGGYETLNESIRDYAAYVSYCRNAECIEKVQNILSPVDQVVNQYGQVIESEGGESRFPLFTREKYQLGRRRVYNIDYGLQSSSAIIIILCKHYKDDRICELDLNYSLDEPERRILIKLSELDLNHIPRVLEHSVINNQSLDWTDDPAGQTRIIDILRGRLAQAWAPPQQQV